MSQTPRLRRFGVELVGSVPWGTHLCQFYESKQDLIDILVPYFTEGLKNNEFCVWVTSAPLGVNEAKEALRKNITDFEKYLQKGQIEILSYRKWYLLDGKFDGDRVLQGWVKKETDALKRGFDGVRITGNLFWVKRSLWKSFVDYEEAINAVIGQHQMLVLCTYCIKNASGTDFVDVIRNHAGALVKQADNWVLVEDAVQRKKEEQQLVQAKDDWERTFDSVPDLIAVLDKHHRIVRVNKPMAKQLGVKPEDCAGLSCFKCVHGTDAPSDICPHAQSMKDGKEHIAELYEPRLGGDFQVSTSPIKEKGRVVGSVHVARNISEQKKVERELTKQQTALQYSNERLSLISSIANELLSAAKPQVLIRELCTKVMNFLSCDVFFNFLVDEEKNLLHLHAYAGIAPKAAKKYEWLSFGESICGSAAEQVQQVVCEHIQDTVDPRSARVRSLGLTAYAAYPLLSGGKVVGTLSFGSKSNSTFTEDELSLMKTVAAQVSIAIDRKRTEEALLKSEAATIASKYTRSLIEASLDPLVTISAEGKITDVNKATELVTGVARDQLIGSDFCDYFTEPEKARAGYKKVFTDSYVKDYPLAIRHTSGSITDVIYNASIFRNEQGQVQGIFAAARDITERKAMENELRETLEKLKQSNAELEQFAYVASHDLQEPLRMVASYVQLLQRRYEGKLDSEADEFIGYAVDGVNRMRGLIDDLLTYSRVGRLGKPFERINLESTMEIVLKNLEASIVEGEATVTHDKLPVVVADGGQLVQLFQNLICNGIKFRGVQPPKVHVSVEDLGGQYQFGVKDNGIGIEPQYFDRLFKIFQRLHTREEYPGTGIGLAICKKIVERHGGHIWIESKVGKGSTIYFTINKKQIR